MLSKAEILQRSAAGKIGGKACLKKYGIEFYSRISIGHGRPTKQSQIDKAFEEWEQQRRVGKGKGGLRVGPRSSSSKDSEDLDTTAIVEPSFTYTDSPSIGFITSITLRGR